MVFWYAKLNNKEMPFHVVQGTESGSLIRLMNIVLDVTTIGDAVAKQPTLISISKDDWKALIAVVSIQQPNAQSKFEVDADEGLIVSIEGPGTVHLTGVEEFPQEESEESPEASESGSPSKRSRNDDGFGGPSTSYSY